MTSIQNHQGKLKRWLQKLRSPASLFLVFPITPNAILYERSLAGKPVTYYETIFLNVLLLIFIVLGAISFVGIQWNPYVGLVGLMVSLPILVVETIRFRSWSFSNDVRRNRALFILLLFISMMYYMKFALNLL